MKTRAVSVRVIQMEAASCETSTRFHQNAWRHIPEYNYLYLNLNWFVRNLY
jgi:hypothetical protein